MSKPGVQKKSSRRIGWHLRCAAGAVAVVMAPATFEARAGVFTIPHFMNPGEFNLGLEPELTLTSGAGLGVNVKFTQGVSDLINAVAVIGTSSGPHRFRVGGDIVFDIFPDIQGQPGIGIAASGIYYRMVDRGQFEILAIPYIHKAFVSGSNEIEPFFAIPVGLALLEGYNVGISSVAMGAIFKSTQNLRYVLEFGIAVNNTDSYLSGGIVYFH